MSKANYSSASQTCIQNRAIKAVKDQHMRPKEGKNEFASNFPPPKEVDSDSSLSDEESRETCSRPKRPKLNDQAFSISSSDDGNSLHLQLEDTPVYGQSQQYPLDEAMTEDTVIIDASFPAPNANVVSKVIVAKKIEPPLKFYLLMGIEAITVTL